MAEYFERKNDNLQDKRCRRKTTEKGREKDRLEIIKFDESWGGSEPDVMSERVCESERGVNDG